MSEPAGGHSDGSAEAEEIFLAALERQESGEAIDVERLCAEHPAQAAELRRLFALSAALDPMLASAAAPEPDPDGPPEDHRFTVEGELGRGGMGVVYRVYDEQLRRTLAMKVLRPSAGSQSLDARRLSRFVEEAEITGRLSHPGIVPIHERGIDEHGRVWFTMPLVEGHDLAEILELLRSGRGSWTRTRVLEVLLRVCDAMAFAHARGVLHRDLKPANVMVGRFGEVYVMDWGLARILDSPETRDLRLAASPESEVELERPLMTMDGDVVGTPAYMSPEQARGDLDALGPHSDVYSVGALLYHLLALEPPYSVDGVPPSSQAVLESVRRGAPTELTRLDPKLPPELVAICEKAMAREIGERYLDMRAMAEDLRAYLEGRVVRVYESGGLAELRKWITRNRNLALSIAAGLLVAFGALIVILLIQYERGRDEILAADHYRLEAYELELGRLWPAEPSMLGAFEDALGRFDELCARLEEHEARARTNPADADLAAYARRLARFADPAEGAAAELRQRIELAETIEARSIGDHAGAWNDAIAHYDAHYAGADAHPLTPQLGLVPLGPDPTSGLLEFAHAQSGDVPARSPTGALELSGEAALVLVLVPAGRHVIGSTPEDPYSVAFRAIEYPRHHVTLPPYFLSKFELTRGQVARLHGEDPSYFEQDAADPTIMPANRLSWREARTLVANWGLRLPTSAQWEAAARAGTTTPWWWGGLESIASDHAQLYKDPPPVVGRFPANPWGFHDMLGSLSEWTNAASPTYKFCDVAAVVGLAPSFVARITVLNPRDPRTGELLLDFEPHPKPEARGGYNQLPSEEVMPGMAAQFSRAALRTGGGADERGTIYGVRPARLLETPDETARRLAR